MTHNDLHVGMKVILDNNVIGYVDGIYPEGKGQYKGKHHAYVWVRTPSLDYISHVWGRHLQFIGFKTTRNGRAVPFSDISKRIQSAYRRDI